MVDALTTVRDEETVEIFVTTLEEIGGERAAKDAERIKSVETEKATKRVLAVDDSKSVLLFYKTLISDMGFEVVTAELQ